MAIFRAEDLKHWYMRMRLFLLICMVVMGTLNAQITQVIRGKVVDRESKAPLIGVNVAVYPAEGEVLGSTTVL